MDKAFWASHALKSIYNELWDSWAAMLILSHWFCMKVGMSTRLISSFLYNSAIIQIFNRNKEKCYDFLTWVLDTQSMHLLWTKPSSSEILILRLCRILTEYQHKVNNNQNLVQTSYVKKRFQSKPCPCLLPRHLPYL